jgi:predicted permease
MEGWIGDFIFGLRVLRKSPMFCLTAIFTLALGIGANTAIFTLLYGLLLRSLPVPQPQQLVRINMIGPTSDKRVRALGIPYPMLQQLRRQQRSFTDVSAWSLNSVTMQDSEGTLRLYRAYMVSGNAFQLLGLKPYIGRLLAPSDDVSGGPPEGWPVVLSYGFWNDRFNGDPSTIGKHFRISGVEVTVAGVTPPLFQGVQPGEDPKLYLPIQFVASREGKEELNAAFSFYFCSPIGRLKPGVTIDQANAEIAVYRNELFSHFIPPRLQHSPFLEKAKLRVNSARTGLPFLRDDYVYSLLLMQGLVGAVLLLCCINVGGLIMSKTHARRHEFAVRTALGAARWRLVRQSLLESFLIAAAGAALGTGAAWFGIKSLLSFFRDPNNQAPISVQPDNTVFLMTGLFAVLTTLLFGTLPAWRAGRSDPGKFLKSRSSLGGRRQIAGRAFVPIQVALSLVLVTLAALLSQSLAHIHGEHAGFDLDHITITTPQFQRLPQKGDALLDVYQRMVDRLEQFPGIQSAAITWITPMTSYQPTAEFKAVSDGENPPEDPRMAYNEVGPGYFEAMKTTILAGREFRRDERARNICVVNQSAANFLFPNQQPVGQYVRSNDAKAFPEGVSCMVVGLAEDAKFGSLRERAPRTIYFPVSKDTMRYAGNLVFMMRSATEAETIAAYRKALTEIAPTTPLLVFATLQEQRDASLGAQRLITILSNVFGGLALFLSALGLYGLLSSSVAQRTGEIGVRIALGARRRTVLWMILTEALHLLAAGIVLGSAALWIVVRFVQGMLFGISPFDPATLALTAALLAGVTLLASFVPAQRAASIDPMQALRAE